MEEKLQERIEQMGIELMVAQDTISELQSLLTQSLQERARCKIAQQRALEEIARLEKELAKWQKELDLVNKKLGNERFVANAKAEVVQKEKDKLADYQEKFDTVKARIAEMKEN